MNSAKYRNAVISTLGKDYLLRNYGTFFQHYCLRRFFESQGVRTVRFSTGEKERNFLGWLLAYALFPVHVLYWYAFRHARWQSLALNYWGELRIESLIQLDYNALIGPFEEAYTISDDTLLIVGSDQILGYLPDCWFSKIADGPTRVIYAGSTDWKESASDTRWLAVAKSELPRFAAVGVREEAGVALCQKYAASNVVVAHVLDPVLLMGREMCELMESKSFRFERPTLLCYFVNIKSQAELCVDIWEHVAQGLGCELRMIGIQGSYKFIPRQYRVLYSPCDFLSAIHSATYVVTNSFHGTAFALLYEKMFLTTRQIDRPGASQNIRQEELLKGVGLIDRWISVADDVDFDLLVNLLKSRIDYASVNRILFLKRDASYKWLQAAINGQHIPSLLKT